MLRREEKGWMAKRKEIMEIATYEKAYAENLIFFSLERRELVAEKDSVDTRINEKTIHESM